MANFGDERLPARFWDKCTPEPNSGCWLFFACQSKAGYGRIGDGRQTKLAHRFSYENLIGQIPDGLVLDHLCRTPCCVNPSHLDPVTDAENLRRGTQVGDMNRARAAAITHCPHGHPRVPENVYITKTKRGIHRSCRRCWKELWYPRQAILRKKKMLAAR